MREPRRRALLIGVEHYGDTRFARLPATRADTASLREVLGDRAIGAFDEIAVHADVTSADLRRLVTEFCGEDGAEDLSLLYVSGHGVRADDGEFHFVTADTDAADVTGTAVRAGFVNDCLQDSWARQKIAVFDTCESGAFATGFRTQPAKGPSPVRPVPLTPRGVYVLGSSDVAQASFVGGGTVAEPEPSVFTGAVVEVLRSGAAGSSAGGMVSVDDMFEAVAARLASCDPPQTPVKSAWRVTAAIPIAARPLGGAIRTASGRLEAPRGVEPTGSPDWPRLLAYITDVVRAEAFQPELLTVRGGEHVVLTGGERFLLGDVDADGAVPVPPGAAQLVAATGGPTDPQLWTGWPAVVLYQSRGAREPVFAPLLVRQVLTVAGPDGPRLRAEGPIVVNPQLVHKLLDHDDDAGLTDGYVPTWHRGEAAAMAGDARLLLRDTFGLPCIEELRPQQLSAAIDLSTSGAGARNVAVLFGVQDSEGITRKLVRDLDRIAERPATIAGTALAALFPGVPPAASADPPELVLPLPANPAQRAVVHGAMSERLTVATGPPGTGKSQLVVDVVATAVAAGQRVLVASTNNPAVDEVHARCEKIIPGLLLRTGNREARGVEAAGLEALLAARPARGSGETGRRTFRAAVRADTEIQLALGATAHQEATLLALGRARDRAHAAVDHPVPDRIDRLGDRWGERAGRLARARFLGGWRRARFLRPLGIEVPDPETLCAALHELATADERWTAARNERPGPSDDELRDGIDRSNDELSATSEQLVRDLVDRNAGAGAAAIRRLWQRKGEMDWTEFRAALPFLPAWAVSSLSARRLPIDPGLFDLVVIDEASQCSIASVLPLLYRARRALIIGDAMQLPHIVSVDAGTDDGLRRRHGVSRDWLGRHRLSPVRHSAFAAAERAFGEPLLLDEHYRCHPDVIAVPNRLFYAGRLAVLTDGAARGRIPVPGPALEWRHVAGRAERGRGGRSWHNPAEVAEVVRCVDDLIAALPVEASIGVVTPYAPQRAALFTALAHHRDRLRIGTAHSFQGGERDVMVYSLVASAGHDRRSFDWADQQPELWNVAITRARSRLIVVGDAEVWQQRGRIGGALLQAVRHGVIDPGTADDELGDQLYDALARVGLRAEFGVPVRGHRADALVAHADGPVPVHLDPGCPTGMDPAAHLRRVLHRTALLGDRAVRLPAWMVGHDPAAAVRTLRRMT